MQVRTAAQNDRELDDVAVGIQEVLFLCEDQKSRSVHD